MNKILGLKTRTTEMAVEALMPPKYKEAGVGEYFLIKTESCLEIAKLIYLASKRSSSTSAEIVRRLASSDLSAIAKQRKEEEKYFEICRRKIKRHNLPMKLIATRISFDGRNLFFYFTAETRIDFRILLKDLVGTFRKLIRLQQIGPRDEAKFLGKMGICGRKLCCRSFIKKLESVSLESAYDQNLENVTSSKISGACGKLMCCLNYEVYLYEKLKKNLPKIGQEVKTDKGAGKVISQNILSSRVLVELKDGSTQEISYEKSLK